MSLVIDLSDETEEEDAFLNELERLEEHLSQSEPKASSSRLFDPHPSELAAAPPSRASKRQKVSDVDVVDLTDEGTLAKLQLLTKKLKTTDKVPAEEMPNLEEDLACPICFDDFMVGPLTLTCGHTFCQHCWTAHNVREPGVCATCRCRTIQPPVRALVLESISDKMAEWTFQRLKASGQGPQATDLLEERRAKLKALQVSRIADARHHRNANPRSAEGTTQHARLAARRYRWH